MRENDLSIGISILVEVSMGGKKPWIHGLQEITGLFTVPGVLVDVEACRRMEGWHGDPTGQSALWHSPEIRLRKVVSKCVRIEYNLGDHPMRPLSAK